MAYCDNCGRYLEDNIGRCPNCGAQNLVDDNMMRCRRCSASIPKGTEMCPECGAQQIVRESLDRRIPDGNIAWGLIGFLMPVIGIVLWIAWRRDRPTDSKLSGQGALLCIYTLVVGTLLIAGTIVGSVSSGVPGLSLLSQYSAVGLIIVGIVMALVGILSITKFPSIAPAMVIAYGIFVAAVAYWNQFIGIDSGMHQVLQYIELIIVAAFGVILAKTVSDNRRNVFNYFSCLFGIIFILYAGYLLLALVGALGYYAALDMVLTSVFYVALMYVPVSVLLSSYREFYGDYILLGEEVYISGPGRKI